MKIVGIVFAAFRFVVNDPYKILKSIPHGWQPLETHLHPRFAVPHNVIPDNVAKLLQQQKDILDKMAQRYSEEQIDTLGVSPNKDGICIRLDGYAEEYPWTKHTPLQPHEQKALFDLFYPPVIIQSQCPYHTAGAHQHIDQDDYAIHN